MTAIDLLKRTLFVAALVPAAALAYNAYRGDLTANPVDYITDQTGTWALTCLMVSLAVSPIRRLTGWNQIIRVRRMIGLFAFFYATLHMLTWVTLVSFFDVPTMIEDVAMRPYITIGMATFLILTVLAATSNRYAISRLGRRWQRLHRLVYLAGILAVIHFWWLVKADTTEPRRWALVLTLLLGLRAFWSFRARTLSRS